MASYFIDPTSTCHRFPSPCLSLSSDGAASRRPAASSRLWVCPWADDLGPTGVVSAASATATAAGRRENFSSGQIDGALAAGFRGEQVARQSRCWSYGVHLWVDKPAP